MRYPDAARLDLVETLHGLPVADPYRWLEDPADPATAAWQQAQDALARPYLDGLPGRDRLRRRLRALIPGSVSAPFVLGARSFVLRREPDQEHAVLVVEEAGRRRTLVDPNARSADATVTLDGYTPSKEGDRVAYLLSDAGSERSLLRVLDTDSGEDVEGPFDVGRGCAVAWLPGGDAYYLVRPDPRAAGPGDNPEYHRRVWLHRVGDDPGGDELVFGEGVDKTAYYGLRTSRDGRWLVVTVALGTAPRNDVHLCDRTGGGHRFTTVQRGVDGETDAFVHRDGRLYLFTTLGAPNGRLAVADPARPEPEHWTDLVAEDPAAVLTDWTPTDSSVVVVRSRDVVAEVHVHDRATGAASGRLDLPGLGVAWVTSRPDEGEDVWVTYTDFTTPPEVLHTPAPDRPLTRWAAPPGAPDVAGIAARQVFVTSADGTRVPMFVVAPDDAAPDPAAPRPTILYGYGGFDIALTPDYSPSIVAWVEAGGVWAVANLRGGSEYGERWHRDGMREHKQHVFDDFHAAAGWLVASGWTDPDHLGISGGSNGGLLVGAALTQHPEAFRSVVCSAPLLDMVRYERFGLGETWNDEYGRADDPEELRWLLGYSPYHHVVDGTRYPAVLFTVFDVDTRVDPLHARKLCAALQAATAADPAERPVLLRREADVGHGARSVSRTVELAVDTLSFHAAQLGLDPSGAGVSGPAAPAGTG